MKILYIILGALSLACSHTSDLAMASGNVSSGGGLPPSGFQYTRAAIDTIINSDAVREQLDDPSHFADSGIISMLPKDGTNGGVWIVTTKQCALEMQFVVNCDHSAICDFSAVALNSCNEKKAE